MRGIVIFFVLIDVFKKNYVKIIRNVVINVDINIKIKLFMGIKKFLGVKVFWEIC